MAQIWPEPRRKCRAHHPGLGPNCPIKQHFDPFFCKFPALAFFFVCADSCTRIFYVACDVVCCNLDHDLSHKHWRCAEKRGLGPPSFTLGTGLHRRVGSGGDGGQAPLVTIFCIVFTYIPLQGGVFRSQTRLPNRGKIFASGSVFKMPSKCGFGVLDFFQTIGSQNINFVDILSIWKFLDFGAGSFLGHKMAR